MKILFIIFMLISELFGSHIIKIASYNVENLFDLKRSGYEYKEYIPFTKARWNTKNYHIKLQHIAKVIKDMNPDIIALQEIESNRSFQALRSQLARDGLYYKYAAIANKKDTTIKVALLSKYKIVAKKDIRVTYSYRYRDILEAKIEINGKTLYLFVNHWKSQDGKESRRVKSAKVLYKEIEKVGFNHHIIALGDFNSNYNEYLTMKKRNNDTNGITGINNILRTIQTQTDAKKAALSLPKKSLYDLWYDTEPSLRYSYIYKHKHSTIDNIIVDKKLLTDSSFHYIDSSIKSFKAPYLFHNHLIYRWKVTKSRPHRHLGKGYSDHLPIEAEFYVK